MVVALIGIGWLVIALMCWALCAMTARADGRSRGEAGSAQTIRARAQVCVRVRVDRDEQETAGLTATAREGLPQLKVRDTRRTALGVQGVHGVR